MRSERVQRSEAFRKSIRREELDNYFAKRRKQMLMADQEKEMNEIKGMLETSWQQEDYLTEMARDLSGEPKEEWLASIRQLRIMTPVFKGDFHLWVSKSIISKICLTFRQEFKHLQLAAQSAKMLVDLICISQPNYSESFIKSLMEYEFAPNVMALATDRMFYLADRLTFVMLVVQLAKTNSSNYSSIVRDGIGSVIVNICNQMRSASHVDVLNIILFLESLTHLLEKPENTKRSLDSQLNSMSVMCVNYIAELISQENAEWSVLCAGMTALIAILKLNRTAIYKELLAIPYAVQRIINLISFGDKTVAIKAINVVAHISYSKMKEIPWILISQGLFQSIIKSYYQMDRRKCKIFHTRVIAILSQIAGSTEAAGQIVGQYELVQIIMNGIASESLKIFAEAIYCIDKLIRSLQYPKLQDFIANNDIINSLCQRITEKIAYPSIYIDILRCSIQLVERNKDVYDWPLDGPIIKAMQLNGLPELVENLRNNHKNKFLCEVADCFIEIFQSIHYENMVPQ